MNRIYLQSIYEYLLTKKEVEGYNFDILLPKGHEIRNKLSSGDRNFMPCAYITGGFFYTTKNFQNPSLDLSKELPGNLFPYITILTENVSESVEIEKTITTLISPPMHLSVTHPFKTDEQITFDVSLDISNKIERTNTNYNGLNGQYTVYQTIIPLFSENVLIFMRDYHPAEIEFDTWAQANLAERGNALEKLEQQCSTLTAEQTQQIHTGYAQISSLLNLPPLDGFGFSELYQVICNKQCDIKTALAECEQAVKDEAKKKQKEERRIEQVKAHYSKLNHKGDIVANRYTEAVIADIKKRMHLDYPISVYGGSTFSEWHYLKELNELEYPSILVRDIIVFTTDYKEFETFAKDGSVIKRPFSAEILPITFQVNIQIYAKNKTQCEEITNQLKQWYSDSQTLSIASPMHDGEELHIQIHYNKNVSEFNGRDFSEEDNLYIGSLWFHKTPCIYYDDALNKTDISNNRLLQINLMEQAIFCGKCSKLLKDTLPKCGQYLDLVRGKKLLFGFLFSEEFKELKNDYDNKLPLDKDKFNRVFRNAVEVYPYLYDKAIQGWSYEQVQADIMKYAELFNKKFSEICTLLDIHFEHKFLPPAYSLDNLREYIELMKGDTHLSLTETIAIIKKEALDERMNVEVDSSASGGILSSLVTQSIESHNIKRHANDSGKRDLLGQAGCAKTNGGNCSNCNIKMGCSRYFI